MPSTVTLRDISSQHLPASVPYAFLAPRLQKPLPLCILLLGAGGTRDSIFDLQPLFDGWWAQGTVPPMIIATPTSGLDYYMEDPSGTIRWDSFLAGDFVPHLRSACNVSDSTVLRASPAAVTVRSSWSSRTPTSSRPLPPCNPCLSRDSANLISARATVCITPLRPPQLIGPTRDPSLWESNNPANRARANAQHLRDSASRFTLRPVTRTSSTLAMALNSSTACSGISTSRTNTILSVAPTTAALPCAPASAPCSPGLDPSGVRRRSMPLPNRPPLPGCNPGCEASPLPARPPPTLPSCRVRTAPGKGRAERPHHKPHLRPLLKKTASFCGSTRRTGEGRRPLPPIARYGLPRQTAFKSTRVVTQELQVYDQRRLTREIGGRGLRPSSFFNTVVCERRASRPRINPRRSRNSADGI